ncbi:MAG: hypothetical protein LBV43_04910 [Prevotella sp.]|jgi:hypothetical protein|nr:hypothetical protein [Prevotella sp.]
MVSLKQLFEWFSTGKFPTEDEFAEQFKSFWHKSEKIPPTSIMNVDEIIGQMQMERRLTLNMGTATMDVYIDEPMTIYKVAGYNVATVKVNGVNVVLDATVSVSIPAKSVVTFECTRTLTDPTAYLYIYAKVKTI